MTTPYPGDLAVAFRSFARRLHEALGQEHEDLVAANEGAHALDQLLRRVAGDLGIAASNDMGATGNAIAQHIEQTRPKDWSTQQLTQLQDDAFEAARLLREIAGR